MTVAYSPEFRRRVLAAYAARGPREAAEMFGVAPQTCCAWARATGVKCGRVRRRRFDEPCTIVKAKRERMPRVVPPKPPTAYEIMTRRAKEQGIGDLETLSDRHILAYYGEELRGGQYEALPPGSVKNLRKSGLVELVGDAYQGRKLALTEKGEAILNELEEI